MKKCLLLNNSYEPLTFISETRAWKLVCRDRVEIIDSWNDYSVSVNGNIIYNPSILRLKDYKYIPINKLVYNKEAIIKRDNNICQYCGMPLERKEITIDHIHPRSKGGKNSFYNCVVACSGCNLQKADQTLTESGFKLRAIPTFPTKMYITLPKVHWNPNWEDYL